MVPNGFCLYIKSMFIIAVDVSGNALSDTPSSSVNAVAGNEIQDELMLMQPRSVAVRVAKFTYLALSTSSPRAYPRELGAT